MIIALSGFFGCGKSSIGRRLSRLIAFPIADLDHIIVAQQGRSIPEIFASDGEQAFRLMEQEALQNFIDNCKDNCILSLGGGTLTTPACAQLVRENTVCLYRRATVDTLASNLDHDNGKRPMLKSEGQTLRERITDLLSARSAIYESTAHHIVDTDDKDDEVIAREIARAAFENQN